MLVPPPQLAGRKQGKAQFHIIQLAKPDAQINYFMHDANNNARTRDAGRLALPAIQGEQVKGSADH